MSLTTAPDRADLLARVLAFDIDGGPAALPFAARLAREHGWSRSHAERVIGEYKRYAYLAATAGITVCPSEDVDAAWHLHLTYTRSYWQRFCGEVLGRPLHHEPTKGGPAEGEKHLAMYAATLAAYRDAFGHEAPADIWPDARERFGDDTRHRVVNTARNWVIPKAPVRRLAGAAAVFALLAVLLPGCDNSFNPFALKRADILVPFALAIVAAVAGGRVIRSVLRTPDERPEDADVRLTWEEVAYLGGGTGRLTTAAIARLVGRGLARVDIDEKTLISTGRAPDDTSPVERAVLGALPVLNESTALKPVEAAVEAAFAREAERLERDGVTLPAGRRAGIAFASLIPLALLYVCLALPQLVMGMQAKRPVDFLVALMIIGGIVGLCVTLAGSLRLSKRGMAILAREKERHDGLRAATRWETNGDAGMAVALFGTAVLVGTPVAPLHAWYPRQTSEASASGCSTGCGSGCGGGDGGGGCGGGGCGGGGD